MKNSDAAAGSSRAFTAPRGTRSSSAWWVLFGACVCLGLVPMPAQAQTTGTSDGVICSITPTGLILERWKELDAQYGPLGCPKEAQTAIPRRNGVRMAFEHGEIATSPDQGAKMAVAAYQQHDDLIFNWGDTHPYSYDKFIVRWDREGKNVGQTDVSRYVHRTRGFLSFQTPAAGHYTFFVEGCDKRLGRSSRCRQGFTVPVRAQYVPPSASRVTAIVGAPLADFADPIAFPTPMNVEQALAGKRDRALKAAHFVACSHALGDVFNHEDNFLNTAIAKLFVVQEEGALRRCPGAHFDLRDEVSNAIRRQEVKSNSGTEAKFPCKREGEYDVALKGFVTLIYRYRQWLSPDVRYRIVHHLLNKRGPHDPSDDRICGRLKIAETENHRMLIESSRYLTNQLLRKTDGSPRYDNARNRDNNGVTMDNYILSMLQKFLQKDFVEYNAKPYQRYTWAGIQNLADYADNPRVKVAARMVLDYVSAKVAVSALDGRRNPPYRRIAGDQVDELFGPKTDPLKDRFQVYTAPSPILRELPVPGWVRGESAAEMVLAAATSYEPPRPVLDLMVNPQQRAFYQRLKHYTAEVYASEPDFLITAGGLPSGYAYAVAGLGKSNDLGVVQPTFMMPTGRFSKLSQMIRFKTPRRANASSGGPSICVAPGFACGLDAVVPTEYTPPERPDCWLRTGRWTFIDFNSARCRSAPESQFGLYVAVAVEPNGFGFFEAVPKRRLIGLDLASFARRTLERNAGTYSSRRTNQYTAWEGNTIRFDLRRANPIISTGLPAIDRLPNNPKRWGFAAGDIIASVGHTGLVVVRNPTTGQRVTLDFRNARNPRRIE